MQKQLHEYQKKIVDFIVNTPKCAIWAEMGSGKSSITLHAIKELNPRNHILIVAPLNIARSTWIDEIKDWNLPFRYLSLIVNKNGNKLKKQKRYELYESLKDRPTSICFINRELLPDLIKWSMSQKPAIWHFPIVVLDESQGFKSPSSERFKYLKKVNGAISRMIQLTGTPMPHDIQDLWSQIYLLDNGLRLGKNITQFRNDFLVPKRVISGIVTEYEPKPGAVQEIYNRISNIVVSIKYQDIAQKYNMSLLPELNINKIKIHMSEKESKIYRQLLKEKVLLLENTKITAKNAGSLYTKLSQMASGTIYTGEDEKNQKTYSVIHEQKTEMCEYIINNTDSPVIIAYHFKSSLDMLCKTISKNKINYKVFDGNPETIKGWNDNKIKVLLLQPKSAGHGLNLQKGLGHTLIWYTLPSSLEEYLQTNARIYRQGQKNNCIIHLLITEHTVDERIYKSLINKSMSQDDLLNAVKLEIENK